MNEAEWNDFLEKHPDSTFFHQLGWKRVVENIFGFKPHYVIVKDGNTVQGILPLFEINQLTGNKLISLPFSTEGGILALTDKARDSLLSQARKIVEDNKLDYLELRQEKNFDSNLESKDYYCHMKLNLDSNPDIVWKNADKKMRNAVRKAQKLGLTTDRGLKYFDAFYKIFSVNMRDLGTPVDKKEFFQEIIKQFPNQIDIIVTKLNNKIISAIFLVKHKKTIKSEWASSFRQYFGFNANQLAYWRAIEDACKEGFEVFDFGRSIKDEGTYRFKEKFGAKPVQMNYKYYINKGKMPDTRKTDWKRSLFSNCWKKLPLVVTNKFGPRLREIVP